MPKVASNFLDKYIVETGLNIETFPRGRRHLPVSAIENREEYYTFGFIRNPWDYQIAYYYFASENLNPSSEYMDLYPTFEDFLNRKTYHRKTLYDNDDYWLSTRHEIVFEGIDYIEKIEQKEKAFDFICDKFNLKPKMNIIEFENNVGRVNASNRDRDYRIYYTDELAQLVADKEKFIIDKYGYKF